MSGVLWRSNHIHTVQLHSNVWAIVLGAGTGMSVFQIRCFHKGLRLPQKRGTVDPGDDDDNWILCASPSLKANCSRNACESLGKTMIIPDFFEWPRTVKMPVLWLHWKQ